MDKTQRYLSYLASSAVLILLWYLASLTAPSFLFPSPPMVVSASYELFYKMNLLGNLLITLARVTIGFLLGAVFGVVAGIAVLMSRLLRSILYPLASLVIVTPSFAFVPLLMIWVGLNDWLPVTAIIICTAFPIIYAFVSSDKYISRDYIESAIIYGASNWELITRIILPLSITHLATILRYEAGHSWRLGFVTEYIALTNGLGALMLYAYSTLRVDEVIALIIVIGAMTYLYQETITFIESKLVKTA